MDDYINMSNLISLENRLQELEASHSNLDVEIRQLNQQIDKEQCDELVNENHKFVGKECIMYLGLGYEGVPSERVKGVILDIEAYKDMFDIIMMKVKTSSDYLVDEEDGNWCKPDPDPDFDGWHWQVSYIELAE